MIRIWSGAHMWQFLGRGALLFAAMQVSVAWGAPAVDQSHVISQSVGGLIIGEDITPAQVFTVGAAGVLSQVDIQIGRDSGNIGALSLEIWPTSAGAPSGASPLFTLPINPSDVTIGSPSASLPYLEVDVSVGALMVSPGEQYAVAISGTAQSGAPNAFWNRGNPGYLQGGNFFGFGSGWQSLSGEFDFGFRTWVDSSVGDLEELILSPLVDAEARLFDSGAAIVNFNGNTIVVDQEVSNGADSRGIFEFDVSALPSDAQIESATFTFDINAFTSGSGGSFPIVELYGFEGDGQALASNARDLSTLLGSSGQITTSSELTSIALNASAVSQLIQGSSILGLTARQAGPPQWVSIVASEYADQFPTVFEAPSLTIQFSAPLQPDLPQGDFNGDARVDAIDYAVWREERGVVGDSPADGDGDGDVDSDDYDLWAENYGVAPDPQVPNGDFETGDLSEWNVVIEPGTDVSAGFPRVESFDVNGDGQASDAMRVRLGQFDPEPGTRGTAGIEQVLLLEGGDYVIAADIASQSLQSFGNTGPGDYELVLDGEVIDAVNLNGTPIDGFEVIRDRLEATVTGVQPGFHTLQLLVSRTATNSREIYHFFDDVTFSLVDSAVATPEPAGIWLLAGLLGLVASRRPPNARRQC